ncbi:hypothetical protein [Kribbella deserti]|uniref:Uncharacterized protein n=1 Tax=Kribbella deserti TaxID=1926257 RepID=A0ABV6QGR3_9ACTN
MARPTSGAYTPPTKAVAKLIDQITATLRDYLEQGATRTDLIKKASKDVVKLRSNFTRNDAPDWQGRSGDYQHAMGEIYSRLNIRDQQRKKMQSLLSHHVNVALREQVDTEDLKALGFQEGSPNDRIAQKRDVNAATAGAVGIQAGNRETLPRAMALASVLVEHAETLTSLPLTAKERAAVKALAADIRKSLDSVLKAL